MHNRVTLYRGYSCEGQEDVNCLMAKLKKEGDLELSNRRLISVPLEKQKSPAYKRSEVNHTVHKKSIKEIVQDIIDLPVDIRRYNIENEVGITGKCVCADWNGAKHYATRERSRIGIVLEVSVPKDRVFVDGLDFLYTLFRDDIVKKFTNINMQFREALVGAYGEKILEYIEEAPRLLEELENIKDFKLLSRDKGNKSEYERHWSSSMFRYVDYICTDADIINAHLDSQTIIRGRYNTVYQAAFAIINGIKETEVIDVLPATNHIQSEYKYEMSIQDIMEWSKK
ncbi:MAG: hypothetical protein ACRCSG_04055 [Cellulosilyticaceae bacterium]